MGRRFWILFFVALTVFAGGGFFLGRFGYLNQVDKVQNWQVRVLTEKAFLFPAEFKNALEARLPVHFEVEVAEDPDTFQEKAAHADILWARKDWILKTELQLKDFKSEATTARALNRDLSADFFDPDETSATLLPLLWTLPLLKVKNSKKSDPIKNPFSLPGEVQWPFWGLNDFFPDLPDRLTRPQADETPAWILFASSSQATAEDTPGVLWFPEKKIRPLVVCLAFVENKNLTDVVKRRLVEAWMEPTGLAKLAFQTKMAVTLVQAEELLPPWQRASALRQVGLIHLARP